ncbi:hypothetical protein BH11BAC4_BH11BAC4_05260 [soil metagenome]
METVVLKSFDNYFSANIILGRLQQNGVQCYLKDEYIVTIDPLLCNAVGGIKLAVDIDDVPDASRLLQEFEEEYLRTVDCPRCTGNNLSHVCRPGTGNFITSILTWLFKSYAVDQEKVYKCQDCHYETLNLPEV